MANMGSSLRGLVDNRREARREVAVFDKFSDEARRVVVLAHQEAQQLDHDHIGAEHLLIAVLRQCESDSGCATAQALAQLGIEPAAAIATINLTPGRAKQAAAGDIPFTPDAKRTLEGALRESIGDASIAPEHVLLALLWLGARTPGTELAEAITVLGVSYADLRKAIRHPGPPPEPPALPYAPSATTALLRAATEARDHDSTSIETAHLLLGILASDRDLTDHVFGAIGIDPAVVSAEVLGYLAPDE
jgi:ATP-dependent Clp protease ATP-binding subunit ClpC